MSSRYDTRTTMFSPEGRLYQVEYASEATRQAGTVIGVRTAEGIALIAERMLQNELFDDENPQDKDISGEKVFRIDDHLGCSVAGVTSDAYALINQARLTAQRHYYTFHEPMAAEDLCRAICDEKQLYTQYGGVRPFGVSFLIVGWDRYHGYQLYSTEPSGDYGAWLACAIGQSDKVAQAMLKKDWKPDMTLTEGILLGLRVMSKTMDNVKLSMERVEVAVLRKVPAPTEQRLLDPYREHVSMVPNFHIMTSEDLKPLLAEAERQRAAEEAAEDERQRQQEAALEAS
ncbi:unnamed protein product [Phytomonas sp. EM1]|nr:unnamed protein product [Phytomonas sp. EM1]|eukprot:CCW64058.1 unnamed protein product [Phytomonas sp. isolate EM1]